MKTYLHRFRRWSILLWVLLSLTLAAGCSQTNTATDNEPALLQNAAIQEDTTAPEAGQGEAEAEAASEDSAPEAEAEAAETEAVVQENILAGEPEQESLDPDGSYTTAEDVSLYLILYGELPGNFITKKEARALGWNGGSLELYAPGKCIGGDYFGNYEGLLPEDREYRECDIDTLGKESRGAKRLVFSDDGLIYYTEDHYESFSLLYGEE